MRELSAIADLVTTDAVGNVLHSSTSRPNVCIRSWDDGRRRELIETEDIPCGMCVDQRGRVYIGDEDGNVLVFGAQASRSDQ